MFLFSVSKDAHISYLLGTHHYLRFDKLPEWLKAFIGNTKIIQLESYIPKDSSGGTRTEILKSNELLKGQSSENHENLYDFANNPKVREVVSGYISSKRNPTFSIDDLTDKGIFILYLQCFGSKKGMDSVIENQAKKQQKTILGLEEPNSNNIYKVLDNMYKNAQTIVQAFESGQMAIFETLYLERKLSFGMLAGSREPGVVSERNLEWFPRFQKSHSEFEGLITCVGVAHLFLENGLLRLLLKAGYSLQIMRIDGSSWTDFTAEDVIKMESEGLYNDVKFGIWDGKFSIELLEIIGKNFSIEQLKIIAEIASKNGDTQVEESIKALLANLSTQQESVADTQTDIAIVPPSTKEDDPNICNIGTLFDDIVF